MTDKFDDEEMPADGDDLIDSADELAAPASAPADRENERAELDALGTADYEPVVIDGKTLGGTTPDNDDLDNESGKGRVLITDAPTAGLAVDEVTEDAEASDTSFALLAVALLVLVGGSVFFAGKLLNAKNETDRAQASAEEALADFDSQLPSTVPILSFEDGEPFATTPPTTTAPNTADASSAEDVQPPSTSTTIARPSVDPSQISLAFVNRVPGDEYGMVGYIDPAGERHITELECSRLDLNEEGGICLSGTAGIAGTGRGLLLDAALNPTLRFGVNKPSRAAVSPDGAVVAWTGFTLGHSYLDPGAFATTTQLISVERRIPADLEKIFKTYRDDVRVDDIDRNYWGVSFVDSDLFYATMGTKFNGTEIVVGRVANSRIDVVASNASCPEVSPDGTTIVAKEQRGDVFQLIAIDVATGARRDLGETRSVDDQVEWIDNQTILYGMPNAEEGTSAQPVFDVYALNTAPGSAPQLIIPFADSPAA